MRRSAAPAQKGMRVYRRAADPASDARRERVPQPGLGPCGAPRDVPALPQQAAPGFAVGRPAGGLAAGGRHRPLRLHHQAEALRRRRFHQDPERHRRPRGPPAGAVDQGRQHRPADHERVRRGDLDQHRQDPQHLSEEGRDRRRRRCRHRGVGPEAQEDDHGQDAAVGDRLQRLRGHRGDRPAALHAVARRARRSRRTRSRPSRATASSSAARRTRRSAARCRNGRRSWRRARSSAAAFRPGSDALARRLSFVLDRPVAVASPSPAAAQSLDIAGPYGNADGCKYAKDGQMEQRRHAAAQAGRVRDLRHRLRVRARCLPPRTAARW